MSSWLKKGRPALLEALATCDKIDEEARAEIQERDRKNSELLDELQKLRSRVAEVDHLQQENKSLKSELDQLREVKESRQSKSPKRRQVFGELSPNKRINPSTTTCQVEADGGLHLQKQYKEIETNLKGISKSLEKHRLKLVKRTKERDDWIKYAEYLEEKNRTPQRTLSLYRSRTAGLLAAQTNEAGDATSTDDENLDIVRERPKSPHPNPQGPQLSRSLVAGLEATNTPTAPTRTFSESPLRSVNKDFLAKDVFKETTDDEDLSAADLELPSHSDHPHDIHSVNVKTEPSSDGPVFVTARPVRKRKHGQEDEPQNRSLQRIKSEHSSSSGPELVGESHHFSPTESLDFEADVHVPTPRKRRALAQDAQTTEGADLDTLGGRLADNSRHETPGSPSTAQTCRTPLQNAGQTSMYHSSALHDTLAHQPRSTTARDHTENKNRRVFQLGLGVMDLEDDGDNGLNSLQRPMVKGRLDALLNTPSVPISMPIDGSIIQRAHIPRPATAHGYKDVLKVPPPRELPHGKRLPPKEATATPMVKKATTPSPKPTVSRERPPKRPSILRDDMPRGRSASRGQRPLRERRMEELRPEDFKPNPNFNDGLTYVYDEVVRGREARAALAGCTDLNCCGKTFRHFAECERDSVGRPTITTRSEDIKLLENYLGDEAWKLGTMTREQREETWLLAKTWELANKFGTHRQRYSRMPTPPGFWNVDFPSTQERAEERRQAEEIRRALVTERYREARRPSGRWLFRDEERR